MAPLSRPLSDASSLQELLHHSPQLWRGTHHSRQRTLASHHPALDAVLPGEGWPVGALTELLPTLTGIGELRACLPALQALSAQHRQIMFVRPPYTPYPPALLRARLSLEHIVLIDAPADEDARWAAEQALRAGAAGAVLLWSETTDDRSLRRLQLAAEAGQALAFLYRSPAALRQPSPAALRIVLEPDGEGLRAQMVKVRGGHRAVVRLGV